MTPGDEIKMIFSMLEDFITSHYSNNKTPLVHTEYIRNDKGHICKIIVTEIPKFQGKIL